MPYSINPARMGATSMATPAPTAAPTAHTQAGTPTTLYQSPAKNPAWDM
jgi:hypothetical protein